MIFRYTLAALFSLIAAIKLLFGFWIVRISTTDRPLGWVLCRDRATGDTVVNEAARRPWIYNGVTIWRTADDASYRQSSAECVTRVNQ